MFTKKDLREQFPKKHDESTLPLLINISKLVARAQLHYVVVAILRLFNWSRTGRNIFLASTSKRPESFQLQADIPDL